MKSSAAPNLLEAVQEAPTSGVDPHALEAGKWSQKKSTNMAHLVVFQFPRDLPRDIFHLEVQKLQRCSLAGGRAGSCNICCGAAHVGGGKVESEGEH